MLPLTYVEPAPYVDPWHLPVQERLRRLAAGTKRVAYFYERADNSTFRYRIYNMAQVLNDGTGEVSAAYFFMNDLSRLTHIADLADVLVICRTRYDQQVSHLINAFRARHKPVLFDTDDFVFDTDYVHLLVESLALDVTNPQVWNDWFAYIGRLGATLKQCDGAITTTETLASRIRDFAGCPVHIVPNFMNREQLAMSERVIGAKQGREPGAGGLVHFGYFSGSPSHTRDFALVAPALEELLERDERVGVVVAGYIEAGQRLERFGKRVQTYPFHDYVNLQRLIGAVEFNLMPLQFNAFTNCKSELKYFEAAAVGTLSIASPSDVYARAIRHGDTGYVARSGVWMDVLTLALDRLDAYGAMAARARADALARYSWTMQRASILHALGFTS